MPSLWPTWPSESASCGNMVPHGNGFDIDIMCITLLYKYIYIYIRIYYCIHWRQDYRHILYIYIYEEYWAWFDVSGTHLGPFCLLTKRSDFVDQKYKDDVGAKLLGSGAWLLATLPGY